MTKTVSEPSYYLNQRHFLLACSAAIALHVLVITGWMLAPGQKVKEVPVRVLNIKLGDGEDIEVSPAMEQPNTAPVERALTQHFDAPAPVIPTPTPKTIPQTTKAPVATPDPKLAVAMQQMAQQFVRPRNNDYKEGAAQKTSGEALGNSAARDAEAIRRYEQLVSSWYWKFHFYPEEARQQQLQSNGILRVEYDRRGNLRNSIIEQSTGYQMLDRAMLDIANRANPFPPVPDNYKPGSAIIAFTIQVKFRLDDRNIP